MIIEDDAAYMTFGEFRALLDYSCSLPTGTTIGKRWRCRTPYHTGPGILHRYDMGEFVPHDDPKLIGIKWRRIFIHHGPGPIAPSDDQPSNSEFVSRETLPSHAHKPQ